MLQTSAAVGVLGQLGVSALKCPGPEAGLLGFALLNLVWVKWATVSPGRPPFSPTSAGNTKELFIAAFSLGLGCFQSELKAEEGKMER